LVRRFIILASLGVLLSGCAAGYVGFGKAPPRLDPVRTASLGASEEPHYAYVEGWGLVLGTPRVLASFPGELHAAPGPNRTVEPCRRQIELAAAAQGAAEVAAASLGPERRTRAGLYEALVEVRIVYRGQPHYEVRQAAVKCTARADGSIVSVEAASAEDEEALAL
jgi:hypothetical protein